MATWQEQAKAAAKGLVLAAGAGAAVATTNIESAAKQISVANNYPTVTTRQIEDEIKRHIRK